MSTDESLAKALGYERTQGVHGKETVGYWRKGEDWYCDACGKLPNWSTSFDACLRDIVPVLRARGLCVRITDVSDLAAFDYDWHVDIRRDYNTGLVAHGGDSLSAAFCEAVVKALEATP